MTTVEQKRIATRRKANAIIALLETIKELGDQGAPSGVMYAALMGHLTYDQYINVINNLRNMGCVRTSNNVVYYVKGL